MPLYEFRCAACNEVSEILQKMSDPNPDTCPHCSGGPLKKLMSRAAFQLKGGGWYETDFRAGGPRAKAPGDGKSEPASKSSDDQSGNKESGASKDTGSASSSSDSNGSSSTSSSSDSAAKSSSSSSSSSGSKSD